MDAALCLICFFLGISIGHWWGKRAQLAQLMALVERIMKSREPTDDADWWRNGGEQ